MKQIVLHELGHVFGCPHVRGTVMDESLSQWLQLQPNLIPKIDQRNQVVFCWLCGDASYSGSLGYSGTEAQVFRRFVGRAPQGKVTAELVFKARKANLVVKDERGSKDIVLTFDGPIHTGFDRGVPLFKVFVKSGAGTDSFQFFNGGRVEYGAIQDAQSHKLNVALEVNSHSLQSSGPYTLRWLENGEAQTLFFADP